MVESSKRKEIRARAILDVRTWGCRPLKSPPAMASTRGVHSGVGGRHGTSTPASHGSQVNPPAVASGSGLRVCVRRDIGWEEGRACPLDRVCVGDAQVIQAQLKNDHDTLLAMLQLGLEFASDSGPNSFTSEDEQAILDALEFVKLEMSQIPQPSQASLPHQSLTPQERDRSGVTMRQSRSQPLPFAASPAVQRRREELGNSLRKTVQEHSHQLWVMEDWLPRVVTAGEAVVRACLLAEDGEAGGKIRGGDIARNYCNSGVDLNESACRQVLHSASEFHFYQLADGSLGFLNPALLPLLIHDVHGQLDDLPNVLLSLDVLDKRTLVVDRKLRNAMPFLSHLPFGLSVDIYDASLEVLLGPKTRERFAAQLDEYKKKCKEARQKKKRQAQIYHAKAVKARAAAETEMMDLLNLPVHSQAIPEIVCTHTFPALRTDKSGLRTAVELSSGRADPITKRFALSEATGRADPSISLSPSHNGPSSAAVGNAGAGSHSFADRAKKLSGVHFPFPTLQTSSMQGRNSFSQGNSWRRGGGLTTNFPPLASSSTSYISAAEAASSLSLPPVPTRASGELRTLLRASNQALDPSHAARSPNAPADSEAETLIHTLETRVPARKGRPRDSHRHEVIDTDTDSKDLA